MRKFTVVNSQTNGDLGVEPIEAKSLEEAQVLVLEVEGMRVVEIENKKKIGEEVGR